MTDHSILTPGLPDLPFKSEARLITRAYKFIAVTVPAALAVAIAAHDMVETLDDFNDTQLDSLGIKRTDIVAYAATKTGLLDL
jgi:hypothetical protein